MQLVLASNNAKKIGEIRAQLPGINLLSLQDVGFSDDIPEPFDTFEQNAAQKAETLWKFCGLPVLADDSGLSVAALGGLPGVRSARYAGAPVDDRRNNEKLLAELKGVEERKAYFTCVIALSGIAEKTVFFEGRMHGTIAKAIAGAGGFGYDPLFIPEGETKTLAELPVAFKSAHSHRAQALLRLQGFLRPTLGPI